MNKGVKNKHSCSVVVFCVAYRTHILGQIYEIIMHVWKPRSALFRIRAFLYAEIVFPHAESAFRMRRSCLRMRGSNSACRDRVFVCGEVTPHAEIVFSCAERALRTRKHDLVATR